MEFYKSRAVGLGLDLQAEVKKATAKIQQNPELWPPHKRSGFRKYFLNRFPFTVFYMEVPDCIWVTAIAHGRRHPDYWKRRRLEEGR
jgi:toxin ParE1/3/4